MQMTAPIQKQTDRLDILCEAKGVSQDFLLPNGKSLRVLCDINLAIQKDEVVALLGPSGCGKSTILRVLAGLINPSEGKVLYHNEPMVGLNPGVAIVFQSFALYPWMTVTENIEAVLHAVGLEQSKITERAQKVIQTVGLTGFQAAYPRELSGGMKQRVGIARALSVDPQLLFLDEPFSQVDALTAESLRAEVLDIWSIKDCNPCSLLMVSHDIKEVAFMADRIVVLSANPGRIRTIVKNDLPRPRDYRSPELLSLVDKLHELITGHELPDAPVAAAPGPPIRYEPLPRSSASEIIGLVEYLNSHGGREDLFQIALDTHREFGHLIAIVKAAELLNFVDTPKSLVVMEANGQKLADGDAEQRKAVWREQLVKLQLYREVLQALRNHPLRAVAREFVLELIILHLPQENYEHVFTTFIRWGRFAELFDYDERSRTISLK